MTLNARILTIAAEVLSRLTEEEASQTKVSLETGFPHRLKLIRPDGEQLTMSFAAGEEGSHMLEVARQFDEGNSSVEHFKWAEGEDEPEAVYAALGDFAGPLAIEK
ncbi:hypothetical protein GCM10025777_37620 [Membranihabitans marinus]|uniref:Uncharacterized protein n=2 Tax=Nesterenkonia rhizosphaerae TaxID=1348272 RepID=A0ABP9G0J3_9MICC